MPKFVKMGWYVFEVSRYDSRCNATYYLHPD